MTQLNLRKTGHVRFATENMRVGQKIQTNYKVMQAIKAQHSTLVVEGMRRELRYEKGELGIYTFWYE